MRSGNGYIDDIIDEKGLEDIKRTLNMEEAKDEEHLEKVHQAIHKELFEEEEETRIYNDSFNVDPKDRIDDEQNWKDEIINDKDNKWGNGSIKQDEGLINDEDDDFGF